MGMLSDQTLESAPRVVDRERSVPVYDSPPLVDRATVHATTTPTQPRARYLVLHERCDPGNHFLDAVAKVRREWELTPVVLTVARTEKEGQCRQRFAEETFARLGRAADCDLVVGCDVRTAVACAARLRGCTHLFVEVGGPLPWWRRLRGDSVRRLRGLSRSLVFLTPSGRSADERPSAVPAPNS